MPDKRPEEAQQQQQEAERDSASPFACIASTMGWGTFHLVSLGMQHNVLFQAFLLSCTVYARGLAVSCRFIALVGCHKPSDCIVPCDFNLQVLTSWLGQVDVPAKSDLKDWELQVSRREFFFRMLAL